MATSTAAAQQLLEFLYDPANQIPPPPFQPYWGSSTARFLAPLAVPGWKERTPARLEIFDELPDRMLEDLARLVAASDERNGSPTKATTQLEVLLATLQEQARVTLLNEQDVVTLLTACEFAARCVFRLVTGSSPSASITFRPEVRQQDVVMDRAWSREGLTRACIEIKHPRPFDAHEPSLLALAGTPLRWNPPQFHARAILIKIGLWACSRAEAEQSENAVVPWAIIFAGTKFLLLRCHRSSPSDPLLILSSSPLDISDGSRPFLALASYVLLASESANAPINERIAAMVAAHEREAKEETFAAEKGGEEVGDAPIATRTRAATASRAPDDRPSQSYFEGSLQDSNAIVIFFEPGCDPLELFMTRVNHRINLEGRREAVAVTCGHEIGRGGTGIVFEGTYGAQKLALKFARAIEDEALSEEARRYEAIPEWVQDVVPTVFGLFTSTDYRVLVLSYEGSRLSGERLKGCSLDVRSRLLAELMTLHGSGWQHGDVRIENVVQQPGGRLRLVDLSHAQDGHHCTPTDCQELGDALALLALPKSLLLTPPLRSAEWKRPS